ncbi:MAG: hypothetical protein M1819_003988 [Sarea resinae]|nr:MAG: hypothetical protein M1819_003988 [Sarea resinae]
MASLFTVPISTGGRITCTTPVPRVYLLTFNSQPDNRLKSDFCNAFYLALDIIEHKHPKGVVVTTSGIQKFYSNGLDLDHANATPGFWKDVLFRLWHRILTYPMPTVALINGHAFAGGFMLAMMHDYRIQNPHRGYLCLNELALGVPLKAPMSSIFRQKVPSPQTYRTLVLEAKRFTALEALKEGIVDSLGGLDEVLTFIDEMKLVNMGGTGVYGKLKAEMWRETVQYLRDPDEQERKWDEMLLRDETRKGESLKRVAEWEKGEAKAKL